MLTHFLARQNGITGNVPALAENLPLENLNLVHNPLTGALPNGVSNTFVMHGLNIWSGSHLAFWESLPRPHSLFALLSTLRRATMREQARAAAGTRDWDESSEHGIVL